ncbi:3-prime end of ExtraCellular Mutant protein [Yamadazyma tenuis]|uniref:Uncharacterized protein n=1 Tax=Candida tenuis (strain ATCC 10573 / BCRC 21748 / CBS 615 / JCM 9827 / NBRC 10315 / NRRL Y-1498 / VKM Y-70) TaxID=590646 RepID=G3AX57_CANTC|nr:uncharacterized protein CANTEDRAFT_117876 [Yamadazyma tenuis ATCC 10573]EGV66694.1 hypothetical protein CANTEDRAFT_117876 [Yamadazyma tenuis ATCC 10573]WEJ95174.1 3-prime end of ExtraCellular Mutant protein [Yamadazyma tenuis]
MQIKSFVALSALSAIALAANNSTLTTATPSVKSACKFDDFTATASADVASVAACATAVGDITIEGDEFGTIELTGVEAIYGNLHIQNATQASAFNAATLQLVSGELSLDANTILASLNLAQLTTVGSFSLTALPALEVIGLTSGITSAESVIISDTGLNTLEGINVVQLKTFNVNNNDQIQLIDSGLQKVTDTLSISFNADSVDVKLDQLSEAKDVYLQSISSFSAANLTKVTGSLSFVSNSIEKIEISSLKSVSNSLTVSKNSDLEEIEFANLTSIGGALVISENDDLSTFAGFPELAKVGGSVSINGSFDNGTFESLESVSGGFNLRSTGDLTCEEFNELNSDGDIKGDKYYCSGANTETSSSSSKSGNANGVSTSSADDEDSSSSSSSSDSTTTTKDSSASAPGGFIALLAGAAAIGLSLY